MPARSVVVVMPFGGTQPEQKRRAILNYKRLEYHIKKCEDQIRSSESDSKVQYNIEVCKTAVSDIPDIVLQQIYSADILIALIVGLNVNVIYEVAVRSTLKRKLILVVDNPHDLPLYLRTFAYLNWRQENIVARIDAIASDHLPKLAGFEAPLPDILRDEIDLYDSGLQSEMKLALQYLESTMESTESPPVQHMRGVVSEECSSSYPISLVEIGFTSAGVYANPNSPSIVSEYDENFIRFYGYSSKAMAAADAPLTLSRLLGRIQNYTDAEDWQLFIADQTRILERMVKNYEFAMASVPIRINDAHPRMEYRNKSLLPCIVAEVIQGDRKGQHKMFLLVIYVQLPDTKSH